MYMEKKKEEIIKLIGEGTDYDKKEMLETNDPESWLKSVSAFANGSGGSLIFGINDDGKVVGLKDAKKDADTITDYVKEYIEPQPSIYIQPIVYDDKELVIVNVYPGRQTPYTYNHRKRRTAYIRIGNASVVADDAKVKELTLKGFNMTYDEMSSSYKPGNLSFRILARSIKERTNAKFNEDKDLLSYGLVNPDGMLNYGGVLISDENPLRHSRVFCTRWNGLTKAHENLDSFDKEEFDHESIIQQLLDAEKFIAIHNKTPWYKTNDGRVELPDYPLRAVEESLVNGLIHRLYSELGSEVHVDIYDDRMEIYSPGGMPDGSLIQDKKLFEVPSIRRNPIIADVFARLDYMEREGSGFKKIIDSYKTAPNYQEGKDPVFKSTHSAFFVVLPNLNYQADSIFDDSDVQAVILDNLMGNQKIVYDFILNNPGISKMQLVEKTGLNSNEVKNAIDSLVKKTLIEYKGDSKREGGYYIINA